MNVLDELKKMKGRYVGNGQNVSLKVDDIIAALEKPAPTDAKQYAAVSQAITSLECIEVWIKNNCTRGPEAEEARLIKERLQQAFGIA